MPTWTTVTIPVETPRGRRYVGHCIVGTGYPRELQRLPRGARVTYRTRPRVELRNAREEARDRTIHHNVWHVENAPAGHLARYCRER